MAKEGSTIGGLMDCFGTAVSMSWQYGVPLEVYVNKFSHTRFEPMGYTKNPDIRIAKSIVDYIFRWLGIDIFARLPRSDDRACGQGGRRERLAGDSRGTRTQSPRPPPRRPAGGTARQDRRSPDWRAVPLLRPAITAQRRMERGPMDGANGHGPNGAKHPATNGHGAKPEAKSSASAGLLSTGKARVAGKATPSTRPASGPRCWSGPAPGCVSIKGAAFPIAPSSSPASRRMPRLARIAARSPFATATATCATTAETAWVAPDA